MKKYEIPRILKNKGKEKLTCVTAYDAFSAQLLNALPVDMILVGDSLGHVIQGKESTVSVTIEDILYHTRIVAANAPKKLVIADMPLGSYGITTEQTVQECLNAFKTTQAGAVKMEGASRLVLKAIRQLYDLGVPVMGHLGFQPQSVNLLGYKIDGKTDEDRSRLIKEAKSLEDAGAFAIVLECVIEDIAKEITESIGIPTIGIGSGGFVDGQVLVFHDILGMTTGKLPSFVRQYANLNQIAKDALQHWLEDVRSCNYPSKEETYQIKSSPSSGPYSVPSADTSKASSKLPSSASSKASSTDSRN
jgi:3-methyl-2-oxobutanoate hydroxymethyltransferase